MNYVWSTSTLTVKRWAFISALFATIKSHPSPSQRMNIGSTHSLAFPSCITPIRITSGKSNHIETLLLHSAWYFPTQISSILHHLGVKTLVPCSPQWNIACKWTLIPPMDPNGIIASGHGFVQKWGKTKTQWMIITSERNGSQVFSRNYAF